MSRFGWGIVAAGLVGLGWASPVLACQAVGALDHGNEVDFVVHGTSQDATVTLELRTMSRGATVTYYDGSEWLPLPVGATVEGTRVQVRNGSGTLAWTSVCGVSWGGGIVQPSDE